MAQPSNHPKNHLKPWQRWLLFSFGTPVFIAANICLCRGLAVLILPHTTDPAPDWLGIIAGVIWTAFPIGYAIDRRYLRSWLSHGEWEDSGYNG